MDHPDAPHLARREAIARAFIESLPHSRSIGLSLPVMGDGRASALLPWSPTLCRADDDLAIHEGAIAVLLDTASGAAVMSHAQGPDLTATLDLRIDHLASPRPGAGLRAEARCLRIEGTIAFVEVSVHEMESEALIARSSGAFTLEYGSAGT